MKVLFALALLAICTQASVLKNVPDFEHNSDEHIDYINNLNTTWKAGHNFKGLKIEHLRRLCGVVVEKKDDTLIKSVEVDATKLPTEFDARTKWPECANVINHIRDQGSCGSCWAVAAASTITDRLCIASNGKKTTPISAQTITSCCTNCVRTEGCQGGDPKRAMAFWARNGVPTGSDYGNKETCQAYLIEPCEHHTKGPRKACGDIVATPKCSNTCYSDESKDFEDKTYAKMYYQSNPWPAEIKAEIMEHGSVEAAFTVYSDFVLYQEGVYQVTPGAKELGGHAVTLIGWGQENGVNYWLAKNSWNTDFGKLGGLFKIEERTAGIIDYVVAGIPKLK